MPKLPGSYERIIGSERKRVADESRVGPANADEPISVTLYLRQRADASSLRGKNLRRAGLGASPDDVCKVIKFASSHGLWIDQVNIGGRVVVASGTVRQISKAFGVKLVQYKLGMDIYRGYEGA